MNQESQDACHNSISVITIMMETHEIKPDYKKSKLYMLHIQLQFLSFFMRMVAGTIKNSVCVRVKRKKAGSLLRGEKENGLKRGKYCHIFVCEVVYNLIASYKPRYAF